MRHGETRPPNFIFRMLVVLLGLVACGPAAFSAPTDPPSPKDPIVQRAPAFASWTITFASAPKPPSAQPTQASKLIIDRPASIAVTKTNRTYREVITFKSGHKTERWISNGIELITLPGSDQVCYVRHGEMIVADAFDYSKSDFQSLEWLSLENYLGIKKYEGKSVFAFGPTPVQAGDNKPRKDKSALLSVEGQLPLSTADEFGVTRTYTYNSPPTSPLIPPEKFLKVFKESGIDFK